jgi:stage II sporulation protein D
MGICNNQLKYIATLIICHSRNPENFRESGILLPQTDSGQAGMTNYSGLISFCIKFIILCFLFTLSFFYFSAGASPSTANTIRVLIVNEVYPKLPSKNERIEKLGTMQGELLVRGSRYAGNIDVWKGENGLYIINELPLEEYIRDVVAAEIVPDWDMEALKAQAVVSRTYALYQKTMNGNSLYHLASSVLHQVYKGKNPDMRIAYAVSATTDEVLTFDGKLIEAFYHSTCGGKTENPEEVFGKGYPYLRSLESSCDLSPYSVWERSIRLDEIAKAVAIAGIQDISIKTYTSTNRVRQLSIKTDSGDTTMNATDFRKALGWSRLPSTNFTLTRIDNAIIFQGSGYGHGVGLCQWGMLKMAREGKNYREILSFFYPGTIIQLYENR